MKRYPAVIGVTVAGLAGILGFHTTDRSGRVPDTLAIGSKGGAGAPHPNQAPHASPPTSRGTATSGSPSSSTTLPTSSSATGTNEQYGYGTLSVAVILKGSKIVDVRLSNLQTIDSYSQALAQQVVPLLRRQVLADQSARINGISGATYTSEAYALSVQSALDQLHSK